MKIKNVTVVTAALTTQVWALLIMEPRMTVCTTCSSLKEAFLSADFVADVV